MSEQRISQPTAGNKTFTVEGLSENELTFIVNATLGVQINSADAKLVYDLQQRLIKILTTPAPVEKAGEDPIIEVAVV